MPSSGIVTWYVESTSSRNASNSSSARSTSSTSSTAGLCWSAGSTGRASRKRASYRLFSASSTSVAAAGRLERAQVQDLAREVPVVERLGGVDALVALQPDQRQVEASAIASASAVLPVPGSPSSSSGRCILSARKVTVASASSHEVAGVAEAGGDVGGRRRQFRLHVINSTEPRRCTWVGSRGHRLLSIDGGGVRGVVALEVLARIEQVLRDETGDPELVLGDWFEYVGGTSTGAIIAGASRWDCRS